ncbi:MAG: AI-2E family transporter [Bacteroidetes bacterium]|nr:AI-2E family transporter [Bacteroidota bacterium]
MVKVISDPVIKFFISVIGIVIIFFTLMELQHIFIPLVIAYFLFLMFEPLNNFLVKHSVPQFFTIILNLIIIIAVLFGISRVIIDSFTNLTGELPYYEQRFNNLISSTAVSLGIKDPIFSNFKVENILINFDYRSFAGGLFSSTVSIFTASFFILFFFIFVSTGHYKLIDAIKHRFVEKNINNSIKKIKKDLKKKEGTSLIPVEELRNIEKQKLKEINESLIDNTFKVITYQVQKYIATKFFISLLSGLLTGLILLVFDVKFFIIWAALTALLNFIPNIGSVIAVIMPGLMALVQFESFGYALLICSIIIIVQNIIGNVLEPKIFGDSLGLNPLVILLSLLLWGYIWGIAGMFIAVPLTAVIKIIISNSTSKNLNFLSNLMSN